MSLVVMFILVFLASIFIAMIAHNMTNTHRSGQTLTADYLADAGIRYADYQLTYSDDGADWRPMPNYPAMTAAYYANPVNVVITPDPSGLVAPMPNDPDYQWLVKGYCRFTYGNGRFLIRVSYEPVQDDPTSRYIKIEAVGRPGLFDPTDPTTYNQHAFLNLRSEKVAYKAIGITDYAVFVTNKDRSVEAMPLGTPNYTTNFGIIGTTGGVNGAMPAMPNEGAPIRVNGDLMWYGKNYVWLDHNRGDNVQVSGDILYSVQATTTSNATANPGTWINNMWASQSADPNFVSYPDFQLVDPNPADQSLTPGDYRDGRSMPDVTGAPRNITRIEPPVVNAPGPAQSLSRYRDLTRNSGVWQQDSSKTWYNTGFYGWGDGIYINNPDDVQKESNLYTLAGNWTQPGSQFWVGPYYNPPGISIQLTPYNLDNNGTAGPEMIITHDSAPGQPKFNWYDANGNLMPGSGERMIMPYPKNGVIFAEGNIRIKGMLPPNVQLTVVSGATIYVDGSVMKYPYSVAPTDPNFTASTLLSDGQKTGGVALLATDYVCVNTTQFFQPAGQVMEAGAGGDYIEVTPDNSFWMNFSSSVDDSAAYGSNTAVKLFVRHTAAPDSGGTFVNMFINYPASTANLNTNPLYSLYSFTASAPSARADVIYSMHNDPTLVSANYPNYATQQYPGWECASWQLAPSSQINLNYNYSSRPGIYNLIGLQVDQSFQAGQGIQDYLLSRVAVQPCDIRIEALMFAQNHSFFVIPGEWFNPDPDDTYVNYAKNNNLRPLGTSDDWPFYGQPLDCQVTVYGAISENVPASIGDSSSWMEKWGWIPFCHGVPKSNYQVSYRSPLDANFQDSNNPDVSLQNKRQGLTIIYDGQLSYPRFTVTSFGTDAQIRPDPYNRTLPLIPKLPVSPQTLYTGKPT
jgi:uncharacterized protein YodC (DUF2158 family)